MPRDSRPPRSLSWWIASGLGCGRSPFAPGTVGSVLGLAVAGTLADVGPPVRVLAVALVAAVGVPATARVARIGVLHGPRGRCGDPSWVVVDEVAGQMLACLAIPAHAGWAWWLAAFASFRVLDIAKPGPIGWLDRRRGAFYVMADDVLAGACVALLVVAVRPAVAPW